MSTYDMTYVTIAIPTYNRQRYLYRTLESLLSQTYKNVEIIISDNASTDNTEKIIKEFMQKDKRIKYFKHKKQISAVENFNFALSKAKYSYFMWAADDDLWRKNYIAEIIKIFKKMNDAVLVATKFCVIDSRGNIKTNKYCSFANYKKDAIDFERYLQENFYHFKANLFYGIYKISVLKEIGGYNTLPVLAASDCLTVHEIMCHGKVYLVNRFLFYKREVFYEDRISNKHFSQIKVFLDMIKTIIIITDNTLSNIYGNNFTYIYKNVKIYFDFNQKLINNYYKNRKMRLTLINFLSTLNLFTTLLPNNVSDLKNRNKVFSGKQ